MKTLPMQLALPVSFLVSICVFIFLLFDQDYSFGEIVLWSLVIGLLTFALQYIINYYYVYLKLKNLYDKMLVLRRRRSQQPVLLEQPDIIAGIVDSFHSLTGNITQEIRQLKKQDLFRKEYVSEISHELKTPIFAIQGFIETLLDGALEDKNVNRKFLKQALKNVNRLNSLVQNLMTITQIEAGEINLAIDAFKIYELVLDVFEDLDNKRTRKGRNIIFELEAHGFESLLVLADEERIRQVLLNLIENAIKYGNPVGKIIVKIENVNGKIRVSIIDDGPGIGAEHLPHLFTRFYTVDKSRSRENGGTGLGLAIVKNLIEAHGEEISVTSTPNVGTTFSFTLTKA
jgi:two-component system phosphate regulon sensor histidine kinase PhoR